MNHWMPLDFLHKGLINPYVSKGGGTRGAGGTSHHSKVHRTWENAELPNPTTGRTSPAEEFVTKTPGDRRGVARLKKPREASRIGTFF